MSYNPNTPCTIGLEWRPARASAGFLDTDNKAIGFVLDANTTDTIDSFWAMFKQVLGTDGIAAVEIYDLTTGGGVVPQPALTLNTFYPTADLYIAPEPWVPGSAGSSTGHLLLRSDLYPAWQVLDSTVLTPFLAANGATYDNDEFVANFYGFGYDFAVQFGDVTGTLDGRWITRVSTWARVAQYYGYDTPPGNVIRPYLWANGRRYWGNAETIVAAQGVREITFDWFANPDTGLPWTSGAATRFDPAGSDPVYGMGFTANPTNNPNNITTILQARMIVESAGTDPRLAIGTTGKIPGPGWRELPLLDPATEAATTIALTVGHRYLFNVRRTSGLAKLGLARLEQVTGPLPGPPTWTSSQPALDPVTRRIVNIGERSNRAYAAVLGISGGGISLDSQPYATASPLDGTDNFPDLNEYFDSSPVNASTSLQQLFTAPATDDYQWLTILVAQVSEVIDGGLAVQIRDAGTDVAVGDPFTVTTADLEDPGHSWQIIGVHNTTAASLVNGTQYYFDITSTATAPSGWLVQVLNTLHGVPPFGPPTGSAAATFGGNTDVASTGSPLVAHDYLDVVVSVATIPDTPAGFAAAPVGQACCMDHILLTWTPSPNPSCSTFASYEIQRRDRSGDPWLTIAVITDQAVSGIADWESRRNEQASYRLRMIRSDGAPSAWSATVNATAAMTGCAGLMFTTNAAPELSVFYQDLNQERSYSFPTNWQEFEPFDGYAIEYGELVKRGVRFDVKLRVRAGRFPCLPGCDSQTGIGLDVFDPIRDLAAASVPYVCVHNESGDRWYASIRTPTGTRRQHGLERSGGFAAYLMNLDLIEVTDTPSPIDAVAGS